MFRQSARTGRFGSTVSSAMLFLIFAGAFLPEAARATTAAGRTPGTFAVSPAGAATYTIPIWAPPGPQGIQPGIALTYDSQQGGGLGYSCSLPSSAHSARMSRAFTPIPGGSCSGGPLGVGWALSGLSSISRCNLTLAQDGASSTVALATSDGLCLDGQRLRLTAGTYGTAGSTYQTEVADFRNVTAHGTAGNGPAYFIVQDRNGRTYTYGNGGSSQVLATGSTTALSWMLNEVSDPSGNTMTVAYNQATGSAVPVTISWTPSASGSSTYNYAMSFTYGTNVPQSSIHGYVAGTAVTNTNLLSSIAIAYSGTAVKTYYLTYTASPTTAREELTQVQECAGTGTGNCLLPTTMTYQPGAAGVGSVKTLSGTVGTVVSSVYDLNGDGRNDLVMVNSSGTVLVA
jgi:hypothetical protein